MQTSGSPKFQPETTIRIETFEWGNPEPKTRLSVVGTQIEMKTKQDELSGSSCSIWGVLQCLRQSSLGPHPRVDRKTRPDNSRKHHLSKSWQRQALRLIWIYRDERINKRPGDTALIWRHHPKVSRAQHRTSWYLDGVAVNRLWIWPFQSPQMSLKSLTSFLSTSSCSPRKPGDLQGI